MARVSWWKFATLVLICVGVLWTVCEGSPVAMASGGFHLPRAPNTDKLLERMVEMAPPLSDYPDIFGGEGPRVLAGPSKGSTFTCIHAEMQACREALIHRQKERERQRERGREKHTHSLSSSHTHEHTPIHHDLA